MRSLFRYLLTLALLVASPLSLAEGAHPAYTAPAPAVGSGGILQIIFSLLLVLAAIMLVAWMLKRMNVTQKSNAHLLKVIGGVAIGQRERVVLLEVEDTWLVVGVGPGQIRTLHTLPKSTASTEAANGTQPEVPFSAWLKKVIEKRDAT